MLKIGINLHILFYLLLSLPGISSPIVSTGFLVGVFPRTSLDLFYLLHPTGWNARPFCVLPPDLCFSCSLTSWHPADWSWDCLPLIKLFVGRAPVFLPFIFISPNRGAQLKWLLIYFNLKLCFLFCIWHYGLGYATVISKPYISVDSKKLS